ncbi:unnamed protein product, partial [Tilletia controversa]
AFWLGGKSKENLVRVRSHVMEPNEMVQLGDDDLIDLGQQNEYSGDFEAVLTLRVQLSSRPPLGHSFLIASATMCDTFAALVTAEEQLREELALTKQRLQTALTSSPTTTLPPPARPYSDLVQDLRLNGHISNFGTSIGTEGAFVPIASHNAITSARMPSNARTS